MSATTHQQQIEAGLRAVFTEGAGAMSLIVPGDGGRRSCVNDTHRTGSDMPSLGYPGVERRLGQWNVAMPAPTTLVSGEFQAWFPTDADCLDYLEWLRWPCGFVCPCCGHPGGWRLGDGGPCVLDAVAAHQ